jgi:undecaprenyl-diphosphatase
MTAVEAAVLGTIQGLTEFLPVSSSAHLYVVPTLLGWRYAGVAFDVALHWGTLLALLFAFGRDWWELARAVFDADAGRRREALVTWLKIVVASVPTVIAGLLLKDAAETRLRSLPLQAATLFVFGFLLWWVDAIRARKETAAAAAVASPGTSVEAVTPGWGPCLVIGAAQALSLIPGVSRSGVTMTAGRAYGLSRVSAARFSFLLATPITIGAGVLELKDVPHDLSATTLAIGVVTAAVVGLLAIRGLIRWLGRAGFGAFFAYRAALAIVIVWVSARS